MSKSVKEFLDEQEKRDSEGKVTLTETELVELQNRVKHYLTSYEVENKLNPSKVAEMLGYTQMHYSRFKLVGTFNKVASCLLFFSNFARLKNMSLSEFMINIENKPLQSPEGQISRGLWKWELDTISFLSKIESNIRTIFTRKSIPDSTDEYKKTKLEIALSISILMTQLNLNDFKLIFSIITDLAKRLEGNNQEKTPDPDENDIKEIKKLRSEIIKILINKVKIDPE